MNEMSIRDKTMHLLGVNGEEMPEMEGSIKDKTLDLLWLDDEERAKRSEEHLAQLYAQLSQLIVSTINQSMNAQMSQHMNMLNSMLQQIAALNQQAVAELKKPKTVSVGGVQTDASGRITSAIVSTNQVTVQ